MSGNGKGLSGEVFKVNLEFVNLLIGKRGRMNLFMKI